ncbi:TlpA family protein disulfide reductase, partial [Sulfurovum sp. bin170]|uniref:TlpA family protein disulfide reductase n=1 Tax=Sulfurovum sp. bin170 TaxID=2695268 RepID=UPI0013E06D26
MFRILATIALLFLFGCDSKTQKEESIFSTTAQKNDPVGVPLVGTLDGNISTTIEKFTLNTIDGKQLNISEIENGLEFKELKDKAIFLVFFGYRCPPCVREIPVLIELTKKYKDFAIVAIEV